MVTARVWYCLISVKKNVLLKNVQNAILAGINTAPDHSPWLKFWPSIDRPVVLGYICFQSCESSASLSESTLAPGCFAYKFFGL
jgi:hypothetical protein